MGAEPHLTTTDVTALHDFYKSYFTGLQTASQGIEPLLKGMARWQLEVFGLVSRRTRAYAELPARLTQCRTPQDFANETAAFWQTAVDQYKDSTARCTDVLVPLWTQQLELEEAPSAKREHEYIVVPSAEPKPAAEAPAAGTTAAAQAASSVHKRRVA